MGLTLGLLNQDCQLSMARRERGVQRGSHHEEQCDVARRNRGRSPSQDAAHHGNDGGPSDVEEFLLSLQSNERSAGSDLLLSRRKTHSVGVPSDESADGHGEEPWRGGQQKAESRRLLHCRSRLSEAADHKSNKDRRLTLFGEGREEGVERQSLNLRGEDQQEEPNMVVGAIISRVSEPWQHRQREARGSHDRPERLQR